MKKSMSKISNLFGSTKSDKQKSLVVFVGLFLLIWSMFLVIAANDKILAISSNTNAHGEIYNESIYSISINYSNVFGVNYVEASGEPDAHPTCTSDTGGNMIVRLSGTTNAHGQDPAGTNYTTPVCYGDLTCSLKTDCEDAEECVVTLSGTTNAHLALCGEYASDLEGNDPYANKICCSSPQTKPNNFCEMQDNKTKCWANGRNINCTWTPLVNVTTWNLTTSELDGGHCCGEGGEWIQGLRCDYSSSGKITCNSPWTVNDQEAGRVKSNSEYYNKYCGRISQFGGSIGLLYDVQSY